MVWPLKENRAAQFKKRNKYRERRQRNLRKQTKRGLKDRWSTPELHKQKRKMKCVVGGVLSSLTTAYFPLVRDIIYPKPLKKVRNTGEGANSTSVANAISTVSLPLVMFSLWFIQFFPKLHIDQKRHNNKPLSEKYLALKGKNKLIEFSYKAVCYNLPVKFGSL